LEDFASPRPALAAAFAAGFSAPFAEVFFRVVRAAGGFASAFAPVPAFRVLVCPFDAMNISSPPERSARRAACAGWNGAQAPSLPGSSHAWKPLASFHGLTPRLSTAA